MDEVQNSPTFCLGLKNSFVVSTLTQQKCPALQPALKALKCPLNAVSGSLLEGLYGKEPLSDREGARLYLTLRNSIPTSDELSPSRDCVATVIDSVRTVVEARKHVVSRLDDKRANSAVSSVTHDFPRSLKEKEVYNLLHNHGYTADFDPVSVLGSFGDGANKTAVCNKILDHYRVDGETVRKASFPDCLFIKR